MRKFSRKLHEQQERGIYSGQLTPADAQALEDEEESTVGENIPISPTPQMAVQLSVARPPIEDDEYVPGSIEELGDSAKAISELVPSGEIKWFYKHLHRLLDKSLDRSATDEKVEIDEDEEVEEVEVEEVKVEEAVKRTIRKSLFEILTELPSDEDVTEWDTFQWDDESAPPEPPTHETPVAEDTVGLEDLADEFGYAGAPGIRQEINRLSDRLNYFVTRVSRSDLDALLDFAAGEYIDALEETGALNQQDLDDLRKSSSEVKKMDAFRFFFVSSFVLPAWTAVSREGKKEVNAAIGALGIPQELEQTIYNQAIGATSSHTGTVRKKLLKLANAGKISADDVDQIEKKIRISMSDLKKIQPGDDIVEKALQKWQGTSPKDRVSAVRQALEQSSEFQGG
jgi:hypothetical protein